MNWKTPITLLVLLGILLGAAFYGWQTIIAPDPTDEKTAKTDGKKKCDNKIVFKRGERIAAENIVVNIYNAGDIPGLAGNTLSALVAKGFKSGVSENAPADRAARNVTIVTDAPSSPEIRMVRMQFRGKVRVAEGEISRGIDVLVGDNFLAVDPNAKTVFRLKRAVATCARA